MAGQGRPPPPSTIPRNSKNGLDVSYPGPLTSQVGPNQELSGGDVGKGRTGACPGETKPGHAGSTTGAQLKDWGENPGQPTMEAGSVTEGTVKQRETPEAQPPWTGSADLQTLIDTWPRLPRAMRTG